MVLNVSFLSRGDRVNWPIRARIVGIIVVLIIAIVLIVELTKQKIEPPQLSPERIAQLRLDYPTYNTSHELVYVNPLTFLEIAEEAESIIIGKVVKQLPQYEIDLIMEKYNFVQYEVAVEKVVRGKSTADTIYLAYNAMFIGHEPELKRGTRLILGTEAGKDVHEGKHFFSRYGTYYIVDDHYVLSTTDDEYSKVMNGKSLQALIKEIKDVRK